MDCDTTDSWDCEPVSLASVDGASKAPFGLSRAFAFWSRSSRSAISSLRIRSSSTAEVIVKNLGGITDDNDNGSLGRPDSYATYLGKVVTTVSRGTIVSTRRTL